MSFNTPFLARSLLRQARPRSLLASPTPRLAAPRLQPSLASCLRAKHTIPSPSPTPSSVKQPAEGQPTAPWAGADAPASEGARPSPRDAYYQLSFTCKPCGHRSHHNVSKQAYHHGSTLITCPGCRNRHVISDHLDIFGDRKLTIEDIMREKGQLVKRGSLGEDGDIEFWPDEFPYDGDSSTKKLSES
jgi:protein import protein ZIM17